MKKRVVFTDPELNSEFQSKGFVVLKNQFSAQQIEEAFRAIKLQSPIEHNMLKGWQSNIVTVPYYSTFLEESHISKKVVLDVLMNVFEHFLNTHLLNYKIIQANIFNKPINTGFVCPHQNLTTVDESIFTSVSIWTPLQNTDIVNGALHLTKGSHKKFEKYRNANIRWSPLKASRKIEDYLMEPIEMCTGDVLIFDDSIVHGSPDNKSKTNRIVFHSIAIPKEANAIYCKPCKDSIEIIQVSDTFWQYFKPGDKEPEEPIIKKDLFIEKVYTIESIKQEIENSTTLYD
ncbi:MAG: phytanoyl-CoA dioxygenase family protein [Chitinophagales bacterium]|nr:phytanoyl-CoA dioxygenase family protein [Chitinophagales bacterium]